MNKNSIFILLFVILPSYIFAQNQGSIKPFEVNEDPDAFVSVEISKVNGGKKLTWFEKQRMILKAEQQKGSSIKRNIVSANKKILDKYECVINDEAKPVLAKMVKVDVIVMATSLYFFAASAQTKLIFDRMFSLYKWDNEAGTMETPLKGKTLVLIVSAFESEGLDVLEKLFALTAYYSGMKFESLLIPNAGVSGDIKNKTGILKKAVALGKKVA